MQLMPETLFLTANLIDRFLEKKRVSRRNLQLVRALSEAPGAPVFCMMCSHLFQHLACLGCGLDAALW